MAGNVKISKQLTGRYVQSLIIMCADTVILDRYGNAVSDASLKAGFDESHLEVRKWYHDAIDGTRTYNALPTLILRSSMTEVQIKALPNIYKQSAVIDDAAAPGRIFQEFEAKGVVKGNSDVLYLIHFVDFRFPLNGVQATGGGTVGNPRYAPGIVFAGGHGALMFGGVFPHFVSLSTVTSPLPNPTTTGTSITVPDGRVFQVAASRVFNPTHFVTSYSSSATTLKTPSGIWNNNRQFFGELGVFPFDAVIWKGARDIKPSPTNAEAIIVTSAVLDNPADPNTGLTITVQRGAYGTTAASIAVDDWINVREPFARVFGVNNQPEDISSESVKITSISGNVLTVVRRTSDALNSGFQSQSRNIQVGDRIASVHASFWQFAHYRRQTTLGGIGHELGHCFGQVYFNASAARNFPVVQNGVVVYINVNSDFTTYAAIQTAPYGTGNLVPSHEASDGNFHHIPHTQVNPDHPGEYNGTKQGSVVPAIMISYYNFPDLGFTASERARITPCPWLIVQPRPV